MTTSNTIHTFTLTQKEGTILLTTGEYPWSTLQVIPTTPQDFDRHVSVLQERGYVAHHDTDRTFLVIHLNSGDIDGTHPDRYIHVTQQNHEQILSDIRDEMAQAAVWYYTNVISNLHLFIIKYKNI